MAGIDKITDKIISDATARADAVKADASEKAREQTQQALAQASEQCDAIIAQAKRTADNAEALSASSGEQQYRRAVLAAKIDILDKALADTREYLLGLPAEDYFAVLAALAASNAHPGKNGVIRLNAADLKRMPAAFEAEVNSRLKGGALTVDTACADICGGLILVYGDIEENCSIEAVISAASDELKDKASELLFE